MEMQKQKRLVIVIFTAPVILLYTYFFVSPIGEVFLLQLIRMGCDLRKELCVHAKLCRAVKGSGLLQILI